MKSKSKTKFVQKKKMNLGRENCVFFALPRFVGTVGLQIIMYSCALVVGLVLVANLYTVGQVYNHFKCLANLNCSQNK